MLHATYADIGGAGARHSRTYKYDAGADIHWAGEQKLVLRGSVSPSNFDTAFQTLNASRTLATCTLLGMCTTICTENIGAPVCAAA